MKRPISLLVLVTALATAAPVLAGETRYVSDELSINMRTGTSTRHQIIQLLRSGTPVEVLESNEDNGYSRIRLANGKEGWVLSRFLADQPSARERLAEAQRELDSLQGDSGKLRDELSSLRSENRKLQNDLTSFRNDNRKLKNEINHVREVSSSAMEIDRENRKLQSALQELETKYQAVEQENSNLRSSSARDWVLVGAGILLTGMLLGLVIPKVRWKKKSSWSSL